MASMSGAAAAAAAGSQEYCLKWNNHPRNVATVFDRWASSSSSSGWQAAGVHSCRFHGCSFLRATMTKALLMRLVAALGFGVDAVELVEDEETGAAPPAD